MELRTRLGTGVALWCGAVVCMGAGLLIWSRSAEGGAMAAAMGAGFGLFGLAALWGYWAEVSNELYIRRRRAEMETPMSFACELASRLTPEQAALVPKFTHDVAVGFDGRTGFYLLTEGGPVPYEWLKGYLERCGVWQMYPIRSYPDGSQGRRYARAFIEWCEHYRFAKGPVGPNPATWVDEGSKQRLMQAIMVDDLARS